MPPSKEFVGLVSEYVHTVAHGEVDGDEEVQRLARRTWGALKRSAKAGPRRSVSTQTPCAASSTATSSSIVSLSFLLVCSAVLPWWAS